MVESADCVIGSTPFKGVRPLEDDIEVWKDKKRPKVTRKDIYMVA
jgi:hypothetical protein